MSTSPELSGDSLEQRVRLHQAKLFFEHSRGNMPSILAAALLVAAVLLDAGTGVITVAGWFVAVLVAAAAVLAYNRHLAGLEITGANYSSLLRKRIALGALVVLLCGISGFFMPPSAPLSSHAFLFLILSGLVTVAALAYSVMPAYYLTLNGVTLVPLTLLFLELYFLHGDSSFLLLVAMSITWQVAILKKARLVSRSVIEGITLNERLQQEVVEHQRSRELIRHMALHDSLTELANRRHFDATLERTLNVAARAQSRFGLLVIDLDDFKPVNDSHGHAVGDRVLQVFAARLQGSLRGSDFAARIGGDEFAVIQENVVDAADVEEVVRKLRVLLDAPLALDGCEIMVGASIGSAVFPNDGCNTESLQRIADQRMYADKRQRKATRS